jgi:hypothetical protein
MSAPETVERGWAVEANPNSGTAAGLLAFLDRLIRKNEMVEATASALRTGCKKVLAVEDDLDAIDIRTADLDDIVRRFRNKERGELKDKVIEVYESRFRQSVEMYQKWLVDDPTWRPQTRRRTSANPYRAGGNRGGNATPGRQATGSAPAAPPEVARQAGLSAQTMTLPGQMITYPIVVRPGVHGKIILPEDLTLREAKRIAAIIPTLALDEPVADTDQYDS